MARSRRWQDRCPPADRAADRRRYHEGPEIRQRSRDQDRPEGSEALRQHRRALARQLLALGVRLTPDHHVSARGDGWPLTPPSFSEWLKRRGIGLHKVRHLNASTLIATQPLPIVAARLGHSRQT